MDTNLNSTLMAAECPLPICTSSRWRLTQRRMLEAEKWSAYCFYCICFTVYHSSSILKIWEICHHWRKNGNITHNLTTKRQALWILWIMPCNLSFCVLMCTGVCTHSGYVLMWKVTKSVAQYICNFIFCLLKLDITLWTFFILLWILEKMASNSWIVFNYKEEA